MADEQTDKTPADKLKDVVSKLKEMEHHSRGNMESLSEIWLLLRSSRRRSSSPSVPMTCSRPAVRSKSSSRK